MKTIPRDIIKPALDLLVPSAKGLTDEQKLEVGKILLAGRKANPADQDFGDWLKATGLSAYAHDMRRDCIWLAENAHLAYHEARVSRRKQSVRASRLEWEEQQAGEGKATNAGVIRRLLKEDPEKKWTPKKFAEALPGISNVERRLREMAKRNDVLREPNPDDVRSTLYHYGTQEERVTAKGLDGKASSHQEKMDKDLANYLVQAYLMLEKAQENLCNHSQDADDAKRRIAQSFEERDGERGWKPRITKPTKVKRELGHLRMVAKEAIFPGMDPDVVGTKGYVCTHIEVKVTE